MSGQKRSAVPHKQRLLTSGTRLLYRNGFNGTTVDAILADAEVPKGSFYHHFGSKETFGVAVLTAYFTDQRTRLQRWTAQTDLSVPDRLLGYHREMADRFVKSGWQYPCLAGKLSQELAWGSEKYRDTLASGFRAWRDALAALLREGQSEGSVRSEESPEHLADAVLATIEGSFVAALSLREPDQLAAVSTCLLDLLGAPA